jgi:transcription termination factor Rho
MNFEELSKMKLQELRVLGKDAGVDSPTIYPKRELIIKILEAQGSQVNEQELPPPEKRKGGRRKKEELSEQAEASSVSSDADEQENTENTAEKEEKEPEQKPAHRPRTKVYSNTAIPELLQNPDCGDCEGILEITPDGYGFLRSENYLPGARDVYVSIAQIRRFNLKTGDKVTGKTRPSREGERYQALLFITASTTIRREANRRLNFDDLTPIYPNKRITLELPNSSRDLAFAPLIWLPDRQGQRGLIVAPPKAVNDAAEEKLPIPLPSITRRSI